uniref:Histone H2A/H2B/H3 domain-containing protein n=1 Tax=Onchocerca volvulus TaxID=6282 RepID=A0A8R1U231_ONCVO
MIKSFLISKTSTIKKVDKRSSSRKNSSFAHAQPVELLEDILKRFIRVIVKRAYLTNFSK